MKTLISSVILSVLFAVSGLQAQVEKREEINKTYKVGSADRLKIDNSFGMTRIDTWDKNELTVKVVISAEKRNEKALQELLERINIEIDESGTLKSFRTDISGNIKNKNGENFRIDYFVNMPATNSLEVEQSFGDLHIGDLKGDASLEVKYGSLEAGTLAGTNIIELSFSKGEIESMGSAEIELKYSNLEVGKCSKIELDQEFSDIVIDEADQVDIRSKYGSLELGVINTVTGSSNFSDFSIEQLNASIDFEGTYGDGIEIKKLSKSFVSVDLEGKFGGFKIGLEDGIEATLVVEASFSELKHAGVAIEFSRMIKEINRANYEGKIGGGGNIIRIESEYGDIRLSN